MIPPNCSTGESFRTSGRGFYGSMSFQSTSQQCQSSEGKNDKYTCNVSQYIGEYYSGSPKMTHFAIFNMFYRMQHLQYRMTSLSKFTIALPWLLIRSILKHNALLHLCLHLPPSNCPSLKFDPSSSPCVRCKVQVLYCYYFVQPESIAKL